MSGMAELPDLGKDTLGRNIWIGTGIFVVVGAILVFVLWPKRPGTARGDVESSGTTGAWTLTEGRCYSGQSHSYYGVEVWGPKGSGISIKLAKDQVHGGWTAHVNETDSCTAGTPQGDCTALVFYEKDCRTLRVALHRSHLVVNGIKALDGSMSMDCTYDKAHVVGDLTFDDCH